MKKVFLTVTALSCLLVMGCKNNLNNTASPEKLFEDKPVTITWNNKASGEIESFQTDVEVYSMNNRKDTALSISSKYRLSMKKIEGVQYSRIDFNPDYNDGLARSIVTSDKEIVFFDTNTMEVEYRMPFENQMSGDLAFLNAETGLSRLNLDLIMSESKRLAFDVTEEDSGLISVSVPNDYFPSESGDARVSTRVSFDPVEEVVNEVEIVTLTEDGDVVTSSNYPVYEDVDGTPVKIGLITIIDTSVPELLDFGEEYQIYESEDDIPELSMSDFEKMVASDSAFETTDLTFGDPADLSSIETVVEMYTDVEINKTDDSVFRLVMGE